MKLIFNALLFSLFYLSTSAKGISLSVTPYPVETSTNAPELTCVKSNKIPTQIKAPEVTPKYIPDDNEIEDELSSYLEERPLNLTQSQKKQGTLGHPQAGSPYRVAIWGDSHLAAAYFTNELIKLLKLPSDQVQPGFIPANMNRAGVRLPLRKTCVSDNWIYEPAYAVPAGAHTPGPGLVNLYSRTPGASLSWDLRKNTPAGGWKQVRFLYQRTSAPQTIAVSIDGATEFDVSLTGPEGPAALELISQNPLSTLNIRLTTGELRYHGLSLPTTSPARLQIDVFGYPGATVSGWKRANMDYLDAWFVMQHYDLVMLEFGTNEGNNKPFDPVKYQQDLRFSILNLRSIFPVSACVLIAPGDRGILISPSLSKKPHKKSLHTKKRKAALTRKISHYHKKTAGKNIHKSSTDLMLYTRIHADISRIQIEVASEYSCHVWSAFDAMGGAGSAYRWAKQSPALMAKDLIHFTAPGYQKLADIFAADLGWSFDEIYITHSP